VSLFAAGLIARQILFREFSGIVMEKAFQHFSNEMTIYLNLWLLEDAKRESRSVILKNSVNLVFPLAR
jgi:hypothetical protein